MKKVYLHLPIVVSLVFSLSSSELFAVREYIELDDRDVEYYAGPLRYYKEYRSEPVAKNKILFPLKACDPLPIHHFGSLPFFITSAIEDAHAYRQGELIALPISQSPLKMGVVRGRCDANGHWAQIYFGYNPHSFEKKEEKHVYQASIFAFKTKDTWHTENFYSQVRAGARLISNMDLGQEVRKHLENPVDFNWRSPVFLDKIRSLLPQVEGLVFSEEQQRVFSTVCYWDQHENKLRGIKYHHKK